MMRELELKNKFNMLIGRFLVWLVIGGVLGRIGVGRLEVESVERPWTCTLKILWESHLQNTCLPDQ